jgi:two-component system, NarL family, response regulator NreC
MKPVRILLADDHQVVREGVRALLERQPEFTVVGETSDGFKVTGLAERLRPDILIVDLVMPGLGGLDVTREVTRRCAGTRVIVLSMHSSDAYVLQALRDGASAFVLKDASSAELIRAVSEALAGRRYLSPPLSEKAIEAYVKRAQGAELDVYETLTPREREVLHLTAEGLSNPAIGKRIQISPRTAETHRSRVMHKLGLRSKTDLIAYAVKRGLI